MKTLWTFVSSSNYYYTHITIGRCSFALWLGGRGQDWQGPGLHQVEAAPQQTDSGDPEKEGSQAQVCGIRVFWRPDQVCSKGVNSINFHNIGR